MKITSNDPIVLEKDYYNNIVSVMEQMANKIESQNKKIGELDMGLTTAMMERDELQELVNNTMKPVSQGDSLEKYRQIAKL